MDPLLIGGLATGGSVLANMFGSGQREKARKRANAAESKRQGVLDAEADAINTGARERYTDFEPQMDARAAELAQFYGGLADASRAQPSVMPTTRSDVTAEAVTGARDGMMRFGDVQGRRLAGLRSFGDLLGDTSRLQARDAAQVGQIGNYKLGSSRVLAQELEAANQKGSGARFLADLLKLGGDVGIRAGLSGSLV